MSKRSILNTTSQKKRDKMIIYTNTTNSSAAGGTVYNSLPAVLVGGSDTPYVFPWCATARDNTINSGNTKGTKFDTATRTSSSCYMVGLKEAVEVQIQNGLPWQWRRICFTYKGRGTLNGFLPNGSATFAASTETSAGWVRVMNSLTAAQQTTFFDLLMQGNQNNDWSDVMTAKVDTERLSVKYDKTITIASGNERGVIRKYNRWHGMNKNLEYDDEESTGTVNPSFYSVDSKRGMGDYWVIDIIRPRLGSTSSDTLSIQPESTLYWHEK